METEAIENVVEVGGARPGTVRWLSGYDADARSLAIVRCEDHDDPMSVYRAACHEYADLDGVSVERIVSGDDAGAYLVGLLEQDEASE